MGINQHRWKQFLSDHVRRVLEKVAERLEWEWKTDMEDPKSYPMNTDYAFAQIKRQITEGSRGRTQIAQQTIELPPSLPPPTHLSELVDERTIRAVYEQQNDGTYQDALKLAVSGDSQGFSAWRKILHAVSTAYLIDRYGHELAPKPRIQFLHRKLLEIADVAGLKELTHQGIVEFLDDLCPCGKKHKVDAIRKLRQRMAVKSSSKS
jgi:hypothetical protein